MRDPSRLDRSTGAPGGRLRWVIRGVGVGVWSLLLVAFWLGAQRTDGGAVEYLFASAEALSGLAWAPALVLALYLARPLLLVPITFVNLASGFVLGPVLGLALALAGTLASASVGYGIGRLLGSIGHGDALPERWPILGALRRRGFESVVAGGLMYLHADAVNLPAGWIGIRFPVFLAGIATGNALTMTSAVLAGASVEGNLRDASLAVDGWTLLLALLLFMVSLLLASWLRRRHARAAANHDEGPALVTADAARDAG